MMIMKTITIFYAFLYLAKDETLKIKTQQGSLGRERGRKKGREKGEKFVNHRNLFD